MNAKLLICCERAAETAAEIAADAAERSVSAGLRADMVAAEYWRSRSAEMDIRATAYRNRVETLLAAA